LARIRSIKPEFWTSEQVMECSLNTRLLFIGMWNFADDLGRLPMSVKTIKASVFPGDDIALDTIRGMIDELSTNGLILRYVVDDKEYLQITGWQHQRIDKPQPGKCPSPVNGYSKTIPGTIPPDRKGEEEKGKDKKDPPLRVVDDWPENFGDAFWQAYPRKTEKLAAMKKLVTLRKSGIVTFEDLMAGVKRYAAIPREPQYTKQPTTWLNAGCWTDETSTGTTNGNRTGNTRTTGHDAILAVAARKARELDRNDQMAGAASATGPAFGDGIDRPRSGGNSDAPGPDQRVNQRFESDDKRIRQGEIIPPDKDVAGVPGRW
jgi:hypothetical protein